MATEGGDSTSDHDAAFAKLSKKHNPYSYKKFVKKSSNDVNVDLGIIEKKRKPKKDYASTDLPFPDLGEQNFAAKNPKAGESRVYCTLTCGF